GFLEFPSQPLQLILDQERHDMGEMHRSEEHTSELSHPSISYAVFCLKKKTNMFRTKWLLGSSCLSGSATHRSPALLSHRRAPRAPSGLFPGLAFSVLFFFFFKC